MSAATWARAAILAAAPAAVLWFGLDAPFVFDDYPAVAANPSVRDPANIAMAWFRLHRAPVYALHALEYAAWEAWPAGFRAVNLLFHVGSSGSSGAWRPPSPAKGPPSGRRSSSRSTR